MNFTYKKACPYCRDMFVYKTDATTAGMFGADMMIFGADFTNHKVVCFLRMKHKEEFDHEMSKVQA